MFVAPRIPNYVIIDYRIIAYRVQNIEYKEWELEKETKVNAEVLLIKSSRIILIFLPAFYLIIWPMTHQKILKKYPF